MQSSRIENCFLVFFIVITLNCVFCVDLSYTEIYTVTDDTRFPVQNPEAVLVAFQKTKNVKGNHLFVAGERITGDHLLANYLDEDSYTKSENIEVQMNYPSLSRKGSTITAIEITASHSADDADAYFFNGGVNQKYASILLTCDQTRRYSYEIFIYGY